MSSKRRSKICYVRFSEEEIQCIHKEMERHGITNFCDFIRMKVGMPSRDIIDRVDMLEKAVIQLQRERFGLENTPTPLSIDEVLLIRKAS